MKRHKSIIALSQDHHHGLLLAQLIKDGAPEYKGLPKDIKGKTAYALDAWESELKIHFENEEKILFPFVLGREILLDKLISEIKEEHSKIKSLCEDLKTSSNKNDLLNELGLALENHIRKEERILFEKIQEVFDDSELDQLAGKIVPVKPNRNSTC
ncbi:MAG: hemerythrin domain-containing protein [Melioribacteraceae bacterium]|nr:hemerythrin domain-containing protein [Melioribacteraceae bacterium]